MSNLLVIEKFTFQTPKYSYFACFGKLLAKFVAEYSCVGSFMLQPLAFLIP